MKEASCMRQAGGFELLLILLFWVGFLSHWSLFTAIHPLFFPSDSTNDPQSSRLIPLFVSTESQVLFTVNYKQPPCFQFVFWNLFWLASIIWLSVVFCFLKDCSSPVTSSKFETFLFLIVGRRMSWMTCSFSAVNNFIAHVRYCIRDSCYCKRRQYRRLPNLRNPCLYK